MSNCGRESRVFKGGAALVVDYGKPVPLYADKTKKSEIAGHVQPGETLPDCEPFAKAGHEWIKVPDQGWIYNGRRAADRTDPAVYFPGKIATRARLLCRLPVLRGYSYGRSADFPESVIAPPKYTASGSKQIDCSSFTWCAINWIYEAGGLHWYTRHQIIGTPDPWSALKAAQQYLCANEIGDDVPTRDGLYLCQTWHDPAALKRGHQFILDVKNEGGTTHHRILQASSHPDAQSVPTWNYYKPATTVYADPYMSRAFHPGPSVMRWARLANVDAFGALI